MDLRVEVIFSFVLSDFLRPKKKLSYTWFWLFVCVYELTIFERATSASSVSTAGPGRLVPTFHEGKELARNVNL